MAVGLPGALRSGMAYQATAGCCRQGQARHCRHTHTTPEMPSRAAFALNRTGKEGKRKLFHSSNEVCGICVNLLKTNSSLSPETLGPSSEATCTSRADSAVESKSRGRGEELQCTGPPAFLYPPLHTLSMSKGESSLLSGLREHFLLMFQIQITGK